MEWYDDETGDRLDMMPKAEMQGRTMLVEAIETWLDIETETIHVITPKRYVK
jgi:hypothetical protein